MQILQYVSQSTERVMSEARHVSINKEAAASYARDISCFLSSKSPQKKRLISWDDSEWHYQRDAAEAGPLTCQYIMVLDSLNFCFWPVPGLEYEHLANGLKQVLEKDVTAFNAEKLAHITEETLASWLPPSTSDATSTIKLTFPQLKERTRKVREVGQVLLEQYDGWACNLVAKARNSAERLIYLLTASFPGFRDEAVYHGEQVFFYIGRENYLQSPEK